MAKVKFSSSVKYKGERIWAHTPFEVADEDVPALVLEGAIIIEPPAPKEHSASEIGGEDAGSIATPPPPPPPDPKAEVLEKELAALAGMTVPQLKEYAELHDIDIRGHTLKDEIRTAIEDALSFEE